MRELTSMEISLITYMRNDRMRISQEERDGKKLLRKLLEKSM